MESMNSSLPFLNSSSPLCGFTTDQGLFGQCRIGYNITSLEPFDLVYYRGASVIYLTFYSFFFFFALKQVGFSLISGKAREEASDNTILTLMAITSFLTICSLSNYKNLSYNDGGLSNALDSVGYGVSTLAIKVTLLIMTFNITNVYIMHTVSVLFSLLHLTRTGCNSGWVL
jgi:hypothetical protein